MQKTLGLALNKFGVIPSSLRESAPVNSARPNLTVSLSGLYHHYYLDTYEQSPPNPDPAQFEYLRFLVPTDEFRVRGGGIGASTVARRNRSTDLGQAFCRWFLHDHLNITYFAHMERVIDQLLHRGFGGCSIERVKSGDSPDYFCAESVDRFYLAEAKSRYTPIGFGNKEFQSWRDQFTRVEIKDRAGVARKVKGFIVATRLASETSGPKVKSTVYAEDPETRGDGSIDDDDAHQLGAAIVSSHYGDVALKLGQRILAAALSGGYAIPPDLQFPGTVWEFRIGPLKGKRFVGGYYQRPGTPPPFEVTEDGLRSSPLAGC